MTLLPVLLPAREVASLPRRLPSIVGDRLRRARIPAGLIAAELGAMTPVHVARTISRSVVGILVDFAAATESYLPVRNWDETTLPFIETRLAETPCFTSRAGAATVVPVADTPRALSTKWGAR